MGRWAACIVIVTFLAACGLGSSSEQHDPHAVPDGYRAYSSSQYDFGIAYPEGWIARMDESTQRELFAPRDFSVEVHLGQPKLANPATTDSLGALLRQFERQGVSVPESIAVDGVTAQRFRIDGPRPSIFVVFAEDGKPWVLSLSTPLGDADDIASFEPVFEQMLATFRRD